MAYKEGVKMKSSDVKKVGFIAAVVVGTLILLKQGRNLPGVKQVARLV